ncbi:protein FRA10AC1 homolog [Bradysia coprophila]|uniref:protein FRA10AC1 homolog n=2 Tax=Bradysia coprophila TaxID=38358 RepID=UPI00187D810E|nr:protein FRA10AC1 homolog [Bradysia coprophila]
MARFGNLNPYDLHKRLINDYILKKPGDTKVLQRDTSKDRTDYDVIRDNHRFLWDDEDDETDSWEKQLAKRYYDKLFKEYCICDLSRYKDNKVAMRWRVEKEVVTGKGQFICGNRTCSDNSGLRSWEVNFAYAEHGTRKNALIKLRLCPDCSKKLNYHSNKREVKKLKKEKRKSGRRSKSASEGNQSPGCSTSAASSKTVTDEEIVESNEEVDVHKNDALEKNVESIEKHCWTKTTDAEEKSREEEFDEYLEDLLL